MKRFFIFVFISIFMVGMISLWGQGFLAQAQEIEPSEPVDDSASAPAATADLAGIASENGQIRVLVQLNMDREFQPEGDLSIEDTAAQRVAIDNAQQQVQVALGRAPRTIHHTYETIPVIAMTVSESGLEQLAASGWVAGITQDVAVPPLLDGTVPIIGADTVVANGYDGTGQAVVILDTGIDGDHPFFTDDSGTSRIVAEACFSSTSLVENSTTLCPDGSETQTGSGAAEVEGAGNACLNGEDNICTHGVHVAGIAAGNGTFAGVAFDGVAPNADIIPIQVFSRFASEAYCGAGQSPCVLSFPSDQLAALEHVYNTLRNSHTIASINMSLGGGQFFSHCDSDSLKPVIDNLLSVGIATVIASGNKGYTNAVGSPACISSAVAVGSTTDADVLSDFSNMSDGVDLLAPGSYINSSYPSNTYKSIPGTSMAAPHVAGAWALMKQRAPNASVADIQFYFEVTGVSVTDNRTLGTVTKPRIQVDAAISLFDENVWQGTTDSDWHTASNWSLNSVPNGDQVVIITNTVSVYPQIAADASLGILRIHDGATVSMVSGTLTVSATLDDQASGQFAGMGGTVVLTNQATQLSQNSSSYFNHLQVGNGTDSLVVTLNSDLDVNGDLVITAEGELQAGTHTISIAGDWDDAAGTFTAETSTVHFDGEAQQIRFATVPTSVEVELLNDDFSAYDASLPTDSCYTTLTPTGWTEDTSPGTSGFKICNFGSAMIALDLDTVSPDTGWLMTPAFDLTPGVTYTVQFDQADFSSVLDNPSFVVDVYLGTSPISSSLTTLVGQAPDVTPIFTFETVSFDFTVNAADTYYLGFEGAQNGIYGLLDNFLVTYDFLPSYSFQPYNMAVSSSSVLSTSMPVAVTNTLTIHPDGVFDITGQVVTVDGTVTNSGALQETQVVDNSPHDFIHIMNKAGSTTTYQGAEMTASAASLGETTVTVYGNQLCSRDGASGSVHRCFEIAPTAVNPATVRFYYDSTEANGNSEGSVQVYDWNGTGWDLENGSYSRSSGADPRYVEVTGVADYEQFALTDSSPAAHANAAAPAVSVVLDGSWLLFNWNETAEVCSYTVYQSSAPFGGFTVHESGITGSEASVLVGNTDAYFYVEAVGCNGTSTADSASVGVTHFALTTD